MSASTVSITANTAVRQRPVLGGDRTRGIDLLAADILVGGSGGGDDRLSSGGKDLSQSMRGEAVLERSREAVHARKGVPNSATALPARRNANKKGVSKSEKPRWQTLISIFTKNLLLVFALLGLAQMIRRLVVNSSTGTDPSVSSPLMAELEQSLRAELEQRITDLESSLQTTRTMLQVQVEVVDRKIDNGIGGLRTELNRKFDDKSMELESLLKARTDSLEKSLNELKAKEWLTKEDLDRFIDNFKKANRGLADDQGYESDLKLLDQVRALARQIVEEEIAKHAADGLGRPDFALGTAGAAVVKHSEPHFVGKRGSWFLGTRGKVFQEADRMLRPSFGEPGQCFPLEGHSGFVQIRLRTAIVPEAITLEHVAQSVAYDRSSAPKDCRVSGWLQNNMDPVVDEEKMLLLTEFTYDLEKSSAQTFDVLESASAGLINMIRLDILSNHGSASHTCIYRLRVHGREPESVSMIATQP